MAGHDSGGAKRTARDEEVLSRLERVEQYEAATRAAIPEVCASLACKNAFLTANDEAFDAAMSGRTEVEAAIATRQKLAAACISCTGESLTPVIVGAALAEHV